jgi:hypothetical protein
MVHDVNDGSLHDLLQFKLKMELFMRISYLNEPRALIIHKLYEKHKKKGFLIE